VWSLVLVLALILLTRRRATLRATFADRRTRWLLAVASLLISVNWGTYIWSVNNGHVVEASLGYFINPLVSVLMGVLILGERMRRPQWVALGIATVGVLVLTVDYGHPPWVALVLASSFGCYGLAKKKANAGAVESLFLETMILAPVALGYLVLLGVSGAATVGDHGTPHVLLMLGTAAITVLPLLCFGGAATRIPLSTLGLMQYLAPTVQFVLGVLVFAEPMPVLRWVGFAIIWFALVVFTAESLRNRSQQRTAATAEPVGA
jgi:chloramphenicol-sensitive protein RarD